VNGFFTKKNSKDWPWGTSRHKDDQNGSEGKEKKKPRTRGGVSPKQRQGGVWDDKKKGEGGEKGQPMDEKRIVVLLQGWVRTGMEGGRKEGLEEKKRGRQNIRGGLHNPRDLY